MLKTVLSYPLTWLAVITVVAIEAALFQWFQPPPPIQAAMIGAGVFLVLLWPVFFVRSPSFGQRLIEMSQVADVYSQAQLQQLESDLDAVGATQGIEQMRMLKEKLESLTEVLKRRLSAGELTFGRYLRTAEQVYLAALDNLHDIAVTLKSVSTINGDYIDVRLQELQAETVHNDEANKEAETLENRRLLLNQQNKKVAELLAQNETAMTALDQTAAALADTKTGRGAASMNAEAAMAELELLAQRAGKYAIAD